MILEEMLSVERRLITEALYIMFFLVANCNANESDDENADCNDCCSLLDYIISGIAETFFLMLFSRYLCNQLIMVLNYVT